MQSLLLPLWKSLNKLWISLNTFSFLALAIGVMSYFVSFSGCFSGTTALGLAPNNKPLEIISAWFKPYNILCPELQ